jgi:WD repeat-containing protein 26
MCQSTEDLKEKANWDGAEGNSRQQLLSELSSRFQIDITKSSANECIGCISPSVMLPEHRLATLLQQVKQSQISNCLYHNTATSPSLYQDHICDRNNFPVTTFVELGTHSGEVWHVVFSHDGSRLASCGSDGLVFIYEVGSFDVLHTLKEHEEGIGALAWSPDDSMIVTGSWDKRARLWNAKVRPPHSSRIPLLT